MMVKLTNSLVVILSLSTYAVFADENVTTSPASNQGIEQIEVTGSVPLLFYKDEMQRAEFSFYEMYNALNDDNKFAITCRRETRLGSRIKSKVCYPQYVLDKMAEETQEVLSAGGAYPSLKQIEFAVKEERAESMKHVEKLVKANPDLLNALIKLNETQALYQQKKSERHPDS